MKILKGVIGLAPLFFIGLLLVFNRPFVGLRLFGYRIGEFLIAAGFGLAIATVLISINKRYLFFFESNSTKIYFSLIVSSFFISIFMYDTNIFDTYVYRISSYIWTTSYIFAGAYLLVIKTY